MHRVVRFAFPGLVVLVAASVLAACGGSGGSNAYDSASIAASAGSAATAASGAPALADAATGSVATSAAGVSGGDASSVPADWNRLVARTAQLTLRVTNVGEAVAWARSLATASGGFVFASQTSMQDGRQIAELTLRVPVDRVDDLLSQLRGGQLVAEVQSEQSSSQDVTGEFVDNESRLTALRETQSRLLALLGRAASLDDVLRLENELQNVRSQIETIQGRQNYLTDATSFSTVTVALYPVGGAGPKVAESGFSPREVVVNAWARSRNAVEALLTIALTLAIVGLVSVPLVAVGWFIWCVTRRRFTRVSTP